MNRWVYFTLGALACCTPIAIVLIQFIFPALADELNYTILASFGFQSLAVLTYPAGVVGTLVVLPTIYFGFVTPTEALLIAGPISLAAGYLQWFVVIPRIFGRAPNPPLNRTHADHARAG
jgi:hypothetical protein